MRLAVAAALVVLTALTAGAEPPPREQYVLHCSGCHGPEGRGVAGWVPSLHELAPVLEQEEVAALAYEPLCRGLLSGKFRRLPSFKEGDLRRHDQRFWALRFARAQPVIERVRRISAMLGCAPSALAIAWALRRPAVAAALVGAKRPEQVRQNVQAAALLRRPAIWPPIEEAFGRIKG